MLRSEHCLMFQNHRSTHAPQWPPDTLVSGRYRVVRKITSGGMGEVYEAYDTKREMPVALKRLAIEESGDTFERERQRHEAYKRLQREAILTSRLGHPGIVNTSDLVYDADGTPVVVMELLQGITLQQHLAYSTVPAHVAADWMAQVLEALAVAHANGVIHRDLKPANLFLTEDPSMPLGVRVKILDFGISKDVSTTEGPDQLNTALTMTNVFLGSYQFASPEQFDPTKKVSPRSDLYSIGVVFFKAVTSAHPAGSISINDLMLRSIFGNIERSPKKLRPEVPAWFDAIVQRALALSPDDRFRSAESMREALLDGMATGAVAPVALPPNTIPPANRTVPPASQPVPPAPPPVIMMPPAPPFWKDPRSWLVVALAIVAFMGWGGWLLALRPR